MQEEPQVKEEQVKDESIADKPVDESRRDPAQAAPQQLNSARRLRELLAIPERDRSDEVWDEIIALEIQFAPGNRAPVGPGGNHIPGAPQQPQHGRNGDPGQRRNQPQGMKPGKRFSGKAKRGPRRQPKQ